MLSNESTTSKLSLTELSVLPVCVRVVGQLDGAAVVLDGDVLGVGRGLGPVAERHGAAVVGGDVHVVRLHRAVAHHRLVEGRALDLGEVAGTLVEGDVAAAAVDERAVAQDRVVGGRRWWRRPRRRLAAPTVESEMTWLSSPTTESLMSSARTEPSTSPVTTLESSMSPPACTAPSPVLTWASSPAATAPSPDTTSLSNVWSTSPKAVMSWFTELSTIVSLSSMLVTSLSWNDWLVVLVTVVK